MVEILASMCRRHRGYSNPDPVHEREGGHTAEPHAKVGAGTAGLKVAAGICYDESFLSVPVSSRGQDTWFSATGPGFESPYRYQLSILQAVSDL